LPGFSFAGFHLEADGTLFRGEALVHLPPKELAALRLLLAYAGQVVTPIQLRRALWGDVHVTADSVPKCLSSLRARLQPEDCIQTVYKRGYRFTAEVRRLTGAPSGGLKRLAILPFATEHGVPDHLGSAIAEETIAQLSGARHPVVSVLAQDSTFTLARRGLTAHEVGVTLNADLVLAGTLRTLASHFRLRAEMVRVEDGTQIWVEDILTDRNRIAGLELELVKRLAYRLNAGDPGDATTLKGAPAPTSSLGWKSESLSIHASAATGPELERSHQHREAFEIFQRAHHEWQTLERHRMQDGLQHLLRATELDPSLIAAQVDLANLCVTEEFYGFMSPSVAADIVRRAAEAIPDVPLRAEAILPALGWVNFHVDHNLPAALWAFSNSAHLPHDPWTTRARVMFALSRHRFAEAIELLRAAIRIDPFSPWLQSRLAWALHLASQAAESVECIRHALAQFPEHEGANLYGAMILAFNGEVERATEIAQELAARLPSFDLATAVHAYALACAGRPADARTILERLQWLSRERFVLSSFTPAVYVALGDHDAALAELRNSADARCPWFFQILADPRLKPLHGRPEFDEMRSILTRIEAAAAQDLEAEE
jgi:DNA-binding winged helix-turn-helix (wHTH) protein